MPLETIGSYALAGSSGAVARGARPIDSAFLNAAFAASPARSGKSNGNIEVSSPAPNVAAYVSPYIRLDLETRLAIVEFRDSVSGQVEQQYPSPRVVREYQQNLPENSILRADGEPGRDEGETSDGADAETSGIGDAEVSAVQIGFGSGGGSPSPVPPAVASAAAAAFAAKQNLPTSGREIAVA